MSFGKERESEAQRLSLQVHNPPNVDAVLTDDDEYDPPSDVDDHKNDPDYYPQERARSLKGVQRRSPYGSSGE